MTSPVKERDEWEEWFREQKAKLEEYTTEIVRLETDLNARVYALFARTAPQRGYTIVTVGPGNPLERTR